MCRFWCTGPASGSIGQHQPGNDDDSDEDGDDDFDGDDGDGDSDGDGDGDDDVVNDGDSQTDSLFLACF